MKFPCVIEHGVRDRFHRCRCRLEDHAELLQPLIFLLHVLNDKCCRRNALLVEGRLERLGGGILVGLEKEFDAVRLIGRDTVRDLNSPTGMSFFFTKPRTSV
jgi:hypothetical protein